MKPACCLVVIAAACSTAFATVVPVAAAGELALASAPSALAAASDHQEDGGEKKGKEEPGGGEKKPEEGGAKPDGEKPEPTVDPKKAKEEREALLKKIFLAEKIEALDDGVVELTYHFERGKEEVQGCDFSPKPEENPKRMRWSQGYEGARWYEQGLVFNESGSWVHKAVWLEVEAEIEYGQLSEIMKPTDIIAVVYAWNKGRRMIGGNLGQQVVCLSSKLRHAKRPNPTSISLVSADTKRTFGMRYSKGIVYALANGRPVVECDDPAWTKKIEPGQVAIVWNGQWVKGIIEKVRIKGRLDPKWLKEETTKL